MISDPIEDFEKACDVAEDSASKMRIDFAIVMKKLSMISSQHEGWYFVCPLVELDELTIAMPIGWQLICVYDPMGVAYSWAK